MTSTSLESLFWESQIQCLQMFCNYVQRNPSSLNDPRLSFFREFLASMGATAIPNNERESKIVTLKEGVLNVQPEEKTSRLIQEIKEQSFEDDMNQEYMNTMGTEVKSFSISDVDAKKIAADSKKLGTKAFEQKNFKDAAISFGRGIKYTLGKSALLFIKRAECLLELQKPLSARRDCDQAIKLNPDASKAYRLRGRAFMRLNKYEEAVRDLSKAEQINHTQEGFLELKEAQKLHEGSKKENVARVINEKLKFQGVTGGNLPNWMTPKLFELVAQDPEMLRAFQNERVMTAIAEIARDSSAFVKYQKDPEVLHAFMKFSKLVSATK